MKQSLHGSALEKCFLPTTYGLMIRALFLNRTASRMLLQLLVMVLFFSAFFVPFALAADFSSSSLHCTSGISSATATGRDNAVFVAESVASEFADEAQTSGLNDEAVASGLNDEAVASGLDDKAVAFGAQSFSTLIADSGQGNAKAPATGNSAEDGAEVFRSALEKTVEAEHTYIMGDRDSRYAATRLCYAEAKRKALEQAGVYMESYTVTSGLQLAEDEIRSITAAVASVEEVEDSMKADGAHLSVICRARVVMRPDDVRARLRDIAADPSWRDTYGSADAGNRSGESPDWQAGRDSSDFGSDFGSNAGPNVTPNVTPDEWDGDTARAGDNFPSRPVAPDARPRRPFQPDASGPRVGPDSGPRLGQDELARKREALELQNRSLSEAAKANVRKGMTRAQVGSMLGHPQDAKRMKRAGHDYDCARFGNVWIVFKDNAAICARKRIEPRSGLGVCHCAGTADSFIWR